MNSRDEDAPSLSCSSLAPAGVAPSPVVLLAPGRFPCDFFWLRLPGVLLGIHRSSSRFWMVATHPCCEDLCMPSQCLLVEQSSQASLMQEGDFGKRAVMKYLCTKCRLGGVRDGMLCSGWKCPECVCLQCGRAATRSLGCSARWKWEIPAHVILQDHV